MKVVILAGGFGTRLAEETDLIPKPMVEIGGRPMLWHIMQHYAYYGFNDFIIALGYKGEMIKRFFLEYPSLHSDLSLNLSSGDIQCYSRQCEDWHVQLMDTGQNTNTGGRIKRLQNLLQDTFMVTYGDGLSDVNMKSLLQYHKDRGAMATITAVRPPARFGGLELDGDVVSKFTEKPSGGEVWINGGFMVCEPTTVAYCDSDQTSWESDVLERVAVSRQLIAYRHSGFWQCMDTLRDKRLLETIWQRGDAPWRR